MCLILKYLILLFFLINLPTKERTKQIQQLPPLDRELEQSHPPRDQVTYRQVRLALERDHLPETNVRSILAAGAHLVRPLDLVHSCLLHNQHTRAVD